jgi:hypothetical protein
MFALKCLLLNKRYVLKYVPKALAEIFPCHHSVEDDTEIFDTIYKWDVPSIQLKVVPRHSDRLSLPLIDPYVPALTP